MATTNVTNVTNVTTTGIAAPPPSEAVTPGAVLFPEPEVLPDDDPADDELARKVETARREGRMRPAGTRPTSPAAMGQESAQLRALARSADGDIRRALCDCGRDYDQTRPDDSTDDAAWAPEQCPGCERDAMNREAAAEMDAEGEAAHRRIVESRWEAVRAPLQFRDATFDGVPIVGTAKQRLVLRQKVALARRYASAFAGRQGNRLFPILLAMRGTTGTFKTYTALALARAVLEASARGAAPRVRYVTFGAVVSRIRETWGSGSGRSSGALSETAMLRELHAPDLLIVDEVSWHALRGDPTSHLYDVVAAREADLRPTVIISNEPTAALRDLLGPALTSRLVRWGPVWEFGDEDLRPLLREAEETAAAVAATSRRAERRA